MQKQSASKLLEFVLWFFDIALFSSKVKNTGFEELKVKAIKLYLLLYA
jgi:hypothetical protein